MLIKAQVIIGVILILFLMAIINMVRRRTLELKYVLAWMICDIVLLIFICIPDTMEKVADFLGIYSPVNMIFFCGFVFSLVIIFSLTVALSRVTAKVRRLAQYVALDEVEKQIEKEETERP